MTFENATAVAGTEMYRDDPRLKRYGLTDTPLAYAPAVTPESPLEFGSRGVILRPLSPLHRGLPQAGGRGCLVCKIGRYRSPRKWAHDDDGEEQRCYCAGNHRVARQEPPCGAAAKLKGRRFWDAGFFSDRPRLSAKTLSAGRIQ